MAALPDVPQSVDADPLETKEWVDALEGVIEKEGPDRAHYLIEKLIGQAREEGVDIPYSATTEYINTIPAEKQPNYPGNPDLEERIRSYIRWNAMAMVVRANKHTNVGGHIASFASSAVLYDVGFNWFWNAASDNHGGDLISQSPDARHARTRDGLVGGNLQPLQPSLVVQGLEHRHRGHGRAVRIGDDPLGGAEHILRVDFADHQGNLGILTPGRGIVHDDGSGCGHLGGVFARHRGTCREQGDVQAGEVGAGSVFDDHLGSGPRQGLSCRPGRREESNLVYREAALSQQGPHDPADLTGGTEYSYTHGAKPTDRRNEARRGARG